MSAPISPTKLDKIERLNELDTITTEICGIHGRQT